MSSNNVYAPNNSQASRTATAGVGNAPPAGGVTTCAAQAAADHAAQLRQGQSTSSAFQNPNQPQHPQEHGDEWGHIPEVVDARPILPLAAFYMGDLRDGLPMLNMQAAFLISAKDFNEKQVGILFFVYGMSQFLCMAPAGYFLDYSDRKIDWVLAAGYAASALTVLTAITAEEAGRNMWLMIIWKILQGGVTAILPPGFNGITLGIVGSTGFTHQVSRNRMMNHIGTALIVAFGSLLAYFLYPNIEALFLISPLASIGMGYNLRRIKPTHVDTDAARGLIIESPTMNEYEQYDEEQEEAAVAAAVQSWQAMQDYPNCDPARAENQQQEILNKLSNLSYTNTTCSPTPPGAVVACGYDEFTSPCGSTKHAISVGDMPAIPNSPAESGTSSSYMPPAMLGYGGTKAAEAQFHQPNTMLLTSPIHENNEGFVIQPNEMRQRPSSPRADNSAQAGRLPSPQPLANRPNTRTYDTGPSFNMGLENRQNSSHLSNPLTQSNMAVTGFSGDAIPRKARTPLAVLRDPTLMIFTAVIFFFHLANSSVLPLVMQSLSLEDPQAGILLSGLCILIAQAFMSYFAKVCGDYSPIWGRKNLFLIGLASLTLRCFLLTGLVSAEIALEEEGGSNFLKVCILSTQFLDAVGAGLLGCLHILVTNDISGGTGRFSLMLGVTTGAMCLGGTVSGYIGQAIAHDYGYPFAFTALGVMSLVPFIMYIVFMPETLPDYARPNQQVFKKRRKRLAALFKRLSESRKRLVAKANPFNRTKRSTEDDIVPDAKAKPLNPDEAASPQVPATANHVELV